MDCAALSHPSTPIPYQPRRFHFSDRGEVRDGFGIISPMAKYDQRLLEEVLKLRVAADWFSAYDCKRIIGKVDFCVAIPFLAA